MQISSVQHEPLIGDIRNVKTRFSRVWDLWQEKGSQVIKTFIQLSYELVFDERFINSLMEILQNIKAYNAHRPKHYEVL